MANMGEIISNIRFIVLTLKNSIVNNMNESLGFYSSLHKYRSTNNEVFLSKHLKLHTDCPLITLSNTIINNLM